MQASKFNGHHFGAVLWVCGLAACLPASAQAFQLTGGVGERYGQTSLGAGGTESAQSYRGTGLYGELRFRFFPLPRGGGGDGAGQVSVDLVGSFGLDSLQNSSQSEFDKMSIRATGGGIDARLSWILLGFSYQLNSNSISATTGTTVTSYSTYAIRGGSSFSLGAGSPFQLLLGVAYSFGTLSTTATRALTGVQGFATLTFRVLEFGGQRN